MLTARPQHAPNIRSMVYIKMPLLSALIRAEGIVFGCEIKALIEGRIAAVASIEDFQWQDCAVSFYLESSPPSDLVGVLRRLYSQLTAPFQVPDIREVRPDRFTTSSNSWYLSPYVGVSTGVFESRAEGLHQALIAANHAITRDMASPCFYQESLEDSEMKALLYHQFLLRSIREGDLGLRFQPQVEMATGMVKGFELLVRPPASDDPNLLSMNTGQMIQFASRFSLIVPLTESVLKSAGQCLDNWRYVSRENATTLAVNIDPHTLLVGWERLLPLLTQNQMKGRLIIELTEINRPMDLDMDLINSKIAELRSLQIGVSLDDFGSGMANFDRVRHLDFDELKIDRHLIDRIDKCPDHEALVRTIIKSYSTNNRRVLAEGIETAEQWRILKDAGCDLGQGYLIGRPQELAEACKIIGRQAQQEATVWSEVRNAIATGKFAQ